jgi:hypothetical protein
LTAMPYAKGHGRTAMSNLWERATHEPVPIPVETELTTEAIESAEQPQLDPVQSQDPDWLAVKAVALAIQAEKAASSLPRPGSSPMAPRPRPISREPEELPSIPLSRSQPVKKPRKRTAAKKKQAPKNESPEASGVA